MRRLPDSWLQPAQGVGADQLAHWSEQARRGLARQLVDAVVCVLAGAGMVVGAAWWIVADGNGNGLVVGLQLAGLLIGGTMVLMALLWMPLLLRRRWAVRHRGWAQCAARSTALRWGPIRLTVVQLILPGAVPSVIFPELPWRSRIRRLVAGDGRLLVLLPRQGKLDILLYAGADGRPCFTDQPAQASGPQILWERRGAAAIAERGLPAADPD